MQGLKTLVKRFLSFDSPKVRKIKRALSLAGSMRDPQDRFATVIMDYPLLVDLAKAYIESKDYDSAQEVIRTCFKLRDEYQQWGGSREAFLVQRLADEFRKTGRDDIAAHILHKVVNFEAGVPVNMLSTVMNVEDLRLTPNKSSKS